MAKSLPGLIQLVAARPSWQGLQHSETGKAVHSIGTQKIGQYFSQQVLPSSAVMEAVTGAAPTVCRALCVVCLCDLPRCLSGYSHLCYKDDDVKGYREEVKLVSDRARNPILSCLSGLSYWNLLSVGHDQALYSGFPQE